MMTPIKMCIWTILMKMGQEVTFSWMIKSMAILEEVTPMSKMQNGRYTSTPEIKELKIESMIEEAIRRNIILITENLNKYQTSDDSI
jgi:hypothetical protein